MDVLVHGKRLRLKPQQAIGKGGEADVFTIGNGQVLKLFKPPSHPDYAGQPHEQQQAEARLAEHQAKLPAFPSHVPGRVVRPEALVTDRSGRIILGYTMRFLHGATVLMRYAERSFARPACRMPPWWRCFVTCTRRSARCIGPAWWLAILTI